MSNFESLVFLLLSSLGVAAATKTCSCVYASKCAGLVPVVSGCIVLAALLISNVLLCVV